MQHKEGWTAVHMLWTPANLMSVLCDHRPHLAAGSGSQPHAPSDLSPVVLQAQRASPQLFLVGHRHLNTKKKVKQPSSPVKTSTPQPWAGKAATQDQSVPSMARDSGMKSTRATLRLAHSTASPVTRCRVTCAVGVAFNDL